MPTMTPTQTLLTAEEFSRLPDPPNGALQELINGAIVQMPPPQGLHGECCLAIGSELRAYVKSKKLGRVFSNDTGFILRRDPDTVRGPDIAYWSYARLPTLPQGEYIDIPPDLAVEVLSPNDRPLPLQEKVSSYQVCGVPLIWVIDPIDRSVGVYRIGEPATILSENDQLDGGTILPGFVLAVRQLFAE